MATTVTLNEARFCFTLCALFPKSSDYWAPHVHSHANFEVLYEAAGCQTLERAPDAGGAFTLIPPRYEHAASYMADGEIYTTSFSFSVADARPSSDLTRKLFALTEPKAIPDRFGGVALLRRCAGLTSEEEIGVTLMYLLTLLCEGFSLSRAPREALCGTPETDLIEAYIDEHISDVDFSCRDLAEHMHVSERQLYRMLDSAYHMTFRKLLTRARMEVARALLLSTDAPIEEIVRRTGYGSPETLANAYRAWYGAPLKRPKSGRQ